MAALIDNLADLMAGLNAVDPSLLRAPAQVYADAAQ